MTLTAADVAAATGLDASDPGAQLLLDRALDLARRWCGWHVTPEQEDTVILDGRGGHSLRLPTLNLVELVSVTEEGIDLDVAKLDISRLGRVVKWPDPDGYWFGVPGGLSWTQRAGAITVVMNHGYASAPAFDAALLSFAGRSHRMAAAGGIQRTAVGPFQYGAAVLKDSSAFIAEEQFALQLYKLEQST